MTHDDRVPAPSPAPPPAAHDIQVDSGNLTARVRVRLPAPWQPSPLGMALRDAAQEAIAGVQFTAVCPGPCAPAERTRVVDDTLANRGRPNLNTGDATLDAVRLKVDVVERTELPDGVLAVARITKPAGLAGPYREQIFAVCVRSVPGSPGIAAQAWAPLDREAELRPILIGACKGFELL